MPKRENREASIRDLTNKSLRKIRAALKERGITVADVDGPSDEPDLRFLQEVQEIERAFDNAPSAQASAPSETSNPVIAPLGAPSASKGTK